jgi:hypothetical protein
MTARTGSRSRGVSRQNFYEILDEKSSSTLNLRSLNCSDSKKSSLPPVNGQRRVPSASALTSKNLKLQKKLPRGKTSPTSNRLDLNRGNNNNYYNHNGADSSASTIVSKDSDFITWSTPASNLTHPAQKRQQKQQQQQQQQQLGDVPQTTNPHSRASNASEDHSYRLGEEDDGVGHVILDIFDNREDRLSSNSNKIANKNSQKRVENDECLVIIDYALETDTAPFADLDDVDIDGESNNQKDDEHYNDDNSYYNNDSNEENIDSNPNTTTDDMYNNRNSQASGKQGQVEQQEQVQVEQSNKAEDNDEEAYNDDSFIDDDMINQEVKGPKVNSEEEIFKSEKQINQNNESFYDEDFASTIEVSNNNNTAKNEQSDAPAVTSLSSSNVEDIDSSENNNNYDEDFDNIETNENNNNNNNSNDQAEIQENVSSTNTFPTTISSTTETNTTNETITNDSNPNNTFEQLPTTITSVPIRSTMHAAANDEDENGGPLSPEEVEMMLISFAQISFHMHSHY